MLLRSTTACIIGSIAMLSVLAGNEIDAHTRVELGSVVAVGSVVFTGVWWLSGWMRGVKDGQARLQESIHALRAVVDNLSCQKGDRLCDELERKSRR